jgi:iron complex outermembrane receptor protein
MDDTTRPDVPIHMDMPGWSETFGYYSKVNFSKGKHHFLINLNSFYNNSIAEMTMYPSDPNENLMFMYTWPDVRTLYNGVFLEDEFVFNCHSILKISTSFGSHINHVASQFGLESIQIFYPELKAQKSRILKSVAARYNHAKLGFEYSFGLAYGERAPSVSEGYGFYLFNSFDGYDNIGNPNLKNEKAFEGSFSIGYKNDKFKTSASATYFRIYDYIIAKTDVSLVPMTIGANGVRIYTALDYATLFNTSISAEIYLSNSFKWFSQATFAKGKDSENKNLPFISPLSYISSLRFIKNQFNAEISVSGNATQINYNSEFGEDKTPSYAILNVSSGYKFKLGTNNFIARIGGENLLDTYYSTYADWNNIPRMGRNFFINLNYSL